MPGMNGLDLAEQLRSIRPELRCMFISGYTDDVVAHRGVLRDGVHLLQKPFTRAGLAAKAREMLLARNDDIFSGR
jgi:YesN/AraC family two-component response regulator